MNPKSRACLMFLTVISLYGLSAIPAETQNLPSPAGPVTIDLGESNGVTQQGITAAIAAAKQDFAAQPERTVTIRFPEGRFDLTPKTQARSIIDVSGINPAGQGRLILSGAGMNRTTLVMPFDAVWILGRGASHISFTDMHMTTANYTVSQGIVAAVARGQVVLDIQPGFPSPASISAPDKRNGRYLRQYTNSATDPQIDQNNRQVAWQEVRPLGGQRWEFDVRPVNRVPPFPIGALIGIKSKQGMGAYFFARSSDIVFDHFKWTQMSRGVFRDGTDKVRVSNSVIERAPPINGQTPCLSTPGGGPQIGQPHDPQTTGNVIENNSFVGTGDDAIAFFNASGVIRGNYIADSFARGILLSRSPGAELQQNEVLRSPILQSNGKQ